MMSNVEWVSFVTAILLVIVFVVLLRFAKVLHEVVDKLEHRLTAEARQVERLQTTVDRMEAAAAIVARNLASSVGRADATDGSPGEAADAALRSTKGTPL